MWGEGGSVLPTLIEGECSKESWVACCGSHSSLEPVSGSVQVMILVSKLTPPSHAESREKTST